MGPWVMKESKVEGTFKFLHLIVPNPGNFMSGCDYANNNPPAPPILDSDIYNKTVARKMYVMRFFSC